MALPIPQGFTHDLLNQCDLVSLIQYIDPSIDLKPRGGNFTARCPFHEERTPSFTVSPTKQTYHCFGCEVSGNAIGFVMKYRSLDFISAVEWLADYLRIPIPRHASQSRASTNKIKALYTALEDAAQFYQAQLHKHSTALEYLKKRGLTDTSIQQFQLGVASPQWDGLFKFLTQQKKHAPAILKEAGLVVQKGVSHYYDRFRARIIFPIRDKQGRCIGLGGRVLDAAHEPKYLNSPETPLFHKNQALYGLYESLVDRKNLGRFWVVEGYLDVITLHQFGFSETVATLGTATSRFHLQQLFRLTEEVVFCFDGDAAGKKAAIRALELSLSVLQDNSSIRFLRLPSGEDPDSWVRQATPEARKALIQQAISLEDFLFQSAQQGLALNTMEGQRALLQRLLPLIKRMPTGIRREQLLQRLARLVNIEVDKLEHLTTHRSYPNKAPTKKTTQTYTVLDRALGLLIQHPSAFTDPLPTPLSDRLKAEHPLLHTLIETVRANPNTHTATLLEQFSDNPALKEQLMALAHYDWLVPFEGVVEEFRDTLTHLDKSIRDRQIKALIEKARQRTITPFEKAQLTQLLNERD